MFTLNRFYNVFIVDFEQVSAAVKCGINYRIYLNASKSLYWKQVRSTKFSFDIFLEIMFVFLLYLLIENFKPKSYCFERNNWIWCLNGYDFESYQTTFHKKNYRNMLLNSTTLFLVYKWPLWIETAVIKLNEIEVFEVLFSKFCCLLREARDKSRLRVAKVFQGHIRNSFSSPTTVLRFIF